MADRRLRFLAFRVSSSVLLILVIAGCAVSIDRPTTRAEESAHTEDVAAESTSPSDREAAHSPPRRWHHLLDPVYRAGWQPIVFGGDGEVRFTDDTLHLDMGNPLTGVVYTDDLASILGPTRDDYEIEFEARRTRGSDFFCGLTFPIGTVGHVTLVLGGWGGSLVGLSSLDGLDASQNDTTQYFKFAKNRWYDVTVRVTPQRIQCAIGGKQIIDVDRSLYSRFDVRPEVLKSVPFGITTFTTDGSIRRLRSRFPAQEP